MNVLLTMFLSSPRLSRNKRKGWVDMYILYKSASQTDRAPIFSKEKEIVDAHCLTEFELCNPRSFIETL